MAFLVVLIALLAGCTGQETASVNPTTAEQPAIPKTLFDRTITCTVAPEATPWMSQAESLVARAEKLDMPLPDDVLLPIYRDADLNRDHNVTMTEAKTFYESYALRSEDALGRSRY